MDSNPWTHSRKLSDYMPYLSTFESLYQASTFRRQYQFSLQSRIQKPHIRCHTCVVIYVLYTNYPLYACTYKLYVNIFNSQFICRLLVPYPVCLPGDNGVMSVGVKIIVQRKSVKQLDKVNSLVDRL